MSLHSGLDTVAIATAGLFSKTYGSTGQKYINNLYASLGLLEDAPALAPIVSGWWNLLRRIIRRKKRK